MHPSELMGVIEDAGVQVTRVTAKEIYAHCPMPSRHARGDSRPSWSINTDTGAHFCFSCGYRGTLRSLVEDLTGKVSRDLGEIITIAGTKRHIENIKKRTGLWVPETKEPDVFVSEYSLRAYDTVPEWACDERLLDPDEVDYFGVKWDSEYDHWIIPVRSFDGALIGWQEKGPKFFNNWPSGMQKSKSLFGLDVFRGGRAILVESPLDCIRLSTVGLTGGLSSYGAHVSKDQMDTLINVADTIVLALDHDETGRSSMLKIINEYRWRTRLKIVRYQKADPKDVGDMNAEQIHRLLRRSTLPGNVHR